MTSGPDSQPRQAPTRCVLWRPPSVAQPPDLLRSLTRRDVEIVDCTDAFSAFAHVCRLERALRAAGAARDPFVLLLVNPAAMPDVPTVLACTAKYASHAATWWYDPAANPKLQAVQPGDTERWAAAYQALRERPSPERPVLRLAVETDGDAADAPISGAAEPESAAPEPKHTRASPGILTSEELAMLLGDTPSSAEQTGVASRNGGHT